MGRIGDLFGEITVAAEEGPEGLQLPPDAWERLRADWSDEDIEEAMGFVQASLVHDELVDAADSVSAHLVELLGRWSESRAWKEAVAGRATLSVEVIRQIVHRLDHLEEVLDACREREGPRPARLRPPAAPADGPRDRGRDAPAGARRGGRVALQRTAASPPRANAISRSFTDAASSCCSQCVACS